MKEIHLVMLRYTMDNSPLDDGGEYAEQVRFAFEDLGNAELVANQMESDNSEDCTLYFVRSHPIMPVVSKQQPSASAPHNP
jgi:hypothetical protein